MIFEPDTKSNKSKNKKVGLRHTKNLLESKGNKQQNEKATWWMGESICKSCISKWLISKTYKYLIQLNRRKKKFTWKMSRWLEQTFFQRHTDGTWKDGPESWNFREKQIETHRNIPSYLWEWLLSKRQEITSVIEDVVKRAPFFTVGGNGKLVQPPWKTVWRFLKELKTELPYNSAMPLLAIYPKKTKTLTHKIYAPYLLQHYLQ